MNPIALILFVILIFVLAVFFLGGAADRHHESCRPADPLDRDREFIDPDMGCNVTLPPSAQDARETPQL
jgi:hypothetical protein